MAKQGQQTETAKTEEQAQHRNVDGTEDKRFQDNGQGDVQHPDADMRLKENRNDPKKVQERNEAMKADEKKEAGKK